MDIRMCLEIPYLYKQPEHVLVMMLWISVCTNNKHIKQVECPWRVFFVAVGMKLKCHII